MSRGSFIQIKPYLDLAKNLIVVEFLRLKWERGCEARAQSFTTPVLWSRYEESSSKIGNHGEYSIRSRKGRELILPTNEENEAQ